MKRIEDGYGGDAVIVVYIALHTLKKLQNHRCAIINNDPKQLVPDISITVIRITISSALFHF